MIDFQTQAVIERRAQLAIGCQLPLLIRAIGALPHLDVRVKRRRGNHAEAVSAVPDEKLERHSSHGQAQARGWQRVPVYLLAKGHGADVAERPTEPGAI